MVEYVTGHTIVARERGVNRTMLRRPRRPTIRDVARSARVSHQTVSRVINGDDYTSARTRARVERVIDRLGYRPSHAARSLASRRTHTVGLVMGDVANPFFPDVVRGVEDVLAPAGYSLILSSSRRDSERELRNVLRLLERDTDGLILGAPQTAAEELTRLGAAAGVPMVFLNRPVRGRHAAAVWIDWRTATAEVVAHLARLGHRRIGLVMPSRAEDRAGHREAWYGAALRDAGLPPAAAWIARESISLEGGRAAALRLLALASRPTALICHSDVMALGVLEACRERRVKVPRDLSVVGWDDVPYAGLMRPALTTVRVPRYELGRAAARTLLGLIGGSVATPEAPLPLELVVRQTCRPPRGSR